MLPVVFASMLAALAGCSLLSLKTPERPLSTRDMNTRILTREYSVHFIAAVDQAADHIAALGDPGLQDTALQWKIGATTQSLRAATQIAPTMSLLDTWALAAQMKDFLQEGHAGGSVFGAQQAAARQVADEQAAAADALAQRLVEPKDLPRDRQFIDRYVRDHPLASLAFLRPSVTELWSRDTGANVKLVDSLGTIPEAMTDVADRLQLYGDALPSQTLWRAELALGQSGYSKEQMRAALDDVNRRLDQLASAAADAPQLVRSAVADVRGSVVTIVDKLDASSVSAITALHAERVALTADVRTEREAALVAVDEQRRALALDAAKLSNDIVITAGAEMRRLAREMVLLVILAAVVLLGLPFAAGYWVGRARRERPARAQ